MVRWGSLDSRISRMSKGVVVDVKEVGVEQGREGREVPDVNQGRKRG